MPRAKKQKRKKRPIKWVMMMLFKLMLLFFVLTGMQVLLLRFINPPFTATIAWGHIQSIIGKGRYSPPSYHWRYLEDISPHLLKAVLAAEDQRFASHHGFDFIEMNRAVKDIFAAGRVRGASTISMQVARTVFLWPERTWPRKITEAYYTILVEFMWDKRRILEIYLNTVDWGAGVIGVEAATLKYFKKSSALLTRSESASMAAILPSPHKWSPVHPNEQVRERKKRIINDMKKMPLL